MARCASQKYRYADLGFLGAFSSDTGLVSSIAEAAEKFRADRTWVEVLTVTSDDGRYKNLEEIIVAGSEPNLPGIGDL